ncbi:MAG: bL9 family ribosomal protein, partial [Bacteroidota bacterium]
MQVIMLQDVDKVGDKHEVVTVKNGFGRNYLIPKGLAIIANQSNLGRLAEMTKREEAVFNGDNFVLIADFINV